ncbi:unnamed protein product, partial [Darwinula stevensoni]
GEPGLCEAEDACSQRIAGSELPQRRQACFHVRDRATICCPTRGSLSSSGRIVGGEDTEPGEYPWMAALIRKSSTLRPFCGGSLISPGHVLTAATCVREDRQNPSSFLVRIGEHNFANMSETEHRDFNVARIHIHPNFTERSWGFYNDLAILELDNPSEDDPATVCLPKKPGEFKGCGAVVTGKEFISSCFNNGKRLVFNETVV